MSYAEVTAASMRSSASPDEKQRSQHRLVEKHKPDLVQDIWAVNATDVPGVARANVVATAAMPNGTTEGGWADKYKHMTVRFVASHVTSARTLTQDTAHAAALRVLGRRRRRRHLAAGHVRRGAGVGLVNRAVAAGDAHHPRGAFVPDAALLAAARPAVPHLYRARPPRQARL